MAVPYIFSTIPNGQTIPLQYLDANFTYIETQIGSLGPGVLTISGGATGLLPNVPTPGDVILSGTLNVANGGTGQTTASAAINALLPPQLGQTGRYLTTDGSTASWGEIASAVTSFSAGTTGLLPVGPSGGAITLAGVLNVANGGTGSTNAQGAMSNLLPTQSGNAGRVLSTNGSGVLSWIPVGGAASLVVGTSPIANGVDGYLLYDNAGVLEQKSISGTGSVVLDTSSTITTPTIVTPSITTPTINQGLLIGQLEKELPLTIAATVVTIDCNTATVFYIYLNSNISSIVINNVPIAGKTFAMTLSLKADGTPRTITWPGSFKWPSGLAPTLTSTNGKVDTIVAYTYDAGTTWYAFVAGQNS